MKNIFIAIVSLFLVLASIPSSAADRKWTSITLTLQCGPDQKDTRCEIKEFEFLPPGDFVRNGTEKGRLSRWMSRTIEAPADYIAENDMDKDLTCEFTGDSGPVSETIILNFADGARKIIYVGFRSGRCFLNSEANLRIKLWPAAQTGGGPHVTPIPVP